MMKFDTIYRGPKAMALFLCLFAYAGFTRAQVSYPVAVYLEAECAAVGENWVTMEDEMASGGTYVVAAEGSVSVMNAPEAVAANLVTFTVPIQVQDSFRLMAHVKGSAPDNDSFWVRVNGGEWRAWDRRISDGDGWVWREVAGSPIEAAAGTLTVDFAFREANTQLDKLFLTNLSRTPEGIDQPSINCDDTTDCVANPAACADALWLEAECADVESEWRYRQEIDVSNGGYITNTNAARLEEPTTTTGDNQLKIMTDELSAGEYYLYFLMNARDNNSNSLWVKVDDNPWINFSYELDGEALATDGFEWRQVTDLNDSTTFMLDAGTHTIIIAHRESGTYLDKIHLSKSATPPTGFGSFAFNCQENTLSATRTPLDLVSDLSVFPNPTTSQLTFEISSAVTGRLEAAVYDFSGRRMQVRSFQKVATTLRDQVDVSMLPAGMYQLIITTEAGVTSRSFVKN